MGLTRMCCLNTLAKKCVCACVRVCVCVCVREGNT